MFCSVFCSVLFYVLFCFVLFSVLFFSVLFFFFCSSLICVQNNAELCAGKGLADYSIIGILYFFFVDDISGLV
jgi:hypothetical protein